MTDATRSLFCFGLGYVAEKLACDIANEGWHVIGTVRTAEKAERFRTAGFDTVVFDGDGAVVPPDGSDWLISIPPGEAGCPAFQAAAGVAETARSITYLSTTGVYGDLNGGWVFEDTPLNSQSPRADKRVLAERQWSGVRPDVRLVRLPGIYGPGRSVFDRLRSGSARRIIKPGQVCSRAHRDDIASGLTAMLKQDAGCGVYHLTDDEPAPPQDVTAFGAELLGLPVPPDTPFDDADLSPMAQSFYAECKRVSNARTKAILGWLPAYPTYREGLRAILKGEP